MDEYGYTLTEVMKIAASLTAFAISIFALAIVLLLIKDGILKLWEVLTIQFHYYKFRIIKLVLSRH